MSKYANESVSVAVCFFLYNSPGINIRTYSCAFSAGHSAFWNLQLIHTAADIPGDGEPVGIDSNIFDNDSHISHIVVLKRDPIVYRRYVCIGILFSDRFFADIDDFQVFSRHHLYHEQNDLFHKIIMELDISAVFFPDAAETLPDQIII